MFCFALPGGLDNIVRYDLRVQRGIIAATSLSPIRCSRPISVICSTAYTVPCSEEFLYSIS